MSIGLLKNNTSLDFKNGSYTKLLLTKTCFVRRPVLGCD